jgi:hypothetical protein
MPNICRNDLGVREEDLSPIAHRTQEILPPHPQNQTMKSGENGTKGALRGTTVSTARRIDTDVSTTPRPNQVKVLIYLQYPTVLNNGVNDLTRLNDSSTGQPFPPSREPETRLPKSMPYGKKDRMFRNDLIL